MKYATVCSGIEAPSVAWHKLGWEAVWFSEIEKFPCQVLAHHYPQVPNLGDMTRIYDTETFKSSTFDLLCGGTPCQSFSVAGLRKGLDDPRGNLLLTFLSLALHKLPRWIIWENVPGVLSSNKGRDFGAFLGGLAECGYGWAYRVLDAQYFGVPQRRRRVFVVGCLGNPARAAAVLFERHSLSGHPAPSREKRQDVAGTLSARTKGGGGLGTDFDLDGGLIAREPLTHCVDISPTLRAGGNRTGGDRPPGTDVDTVESLVSVFDPTQITSKTNRSQPTIELCHTLPAMGYAPVAFGAKNSPSQGLSYSEHITPTLDKSKTPGVMQGTAVRRLTPVECERLQGFPDFYTAIPCKKVSKRKLELDYLKYLMRGGWKTEEECARLADDGPRYKALGNSMAVPVLLWLGKRIELVNAI